MLQGWLARWLVSFRGEMIPFWIGSQTGWMFLNPWLWSQFLGWLYVGWWL